jgi:hypothetical protein
MGRNRRARLERAEERLFARYGLAPRSYRRQPWLHCTAPSAARHRGRRTPTHSNDGERHEDSLQLDAVLERRKIVLPEN